MDFSVSLHICSSGSGKGSDLVKVTSLSLSQGYGYLTKAGCCPVLNCSGLAEELMRLAGPAMEPGCSLLLPFLSLIAGNPSIFRIILIGHLASDTQMSGTFVTQALHTFFRILASVCCLVTPACHCPRHCPPLIWLSRNKV